MRISFGCTTFFCDVLIDINLLLTIAKSVLINRELSNESFQLRHIENFNGIETKILIDTPKHTNQGFIVDIACAGFINIFNHVCGAF